ncbi:hypothetical protein HMPREF0972_02425 [Actinomyces sp. oral taxon 848 str. F0332]|nr:hypothetical protein HMPREF0972_02425 [Actinomyces sp. oral taxon 848 str. F0332]
MPLNYRNKRKILKIIVYNIFTYFILIREQIDIFLIYSYLSKIFSLVKQR